MPLVLRIGGWRRGRIIALMDWRPGILAVLPLRMADSRYPFHSAWPEGRGWYNFAKAVDWTGREHSPVPGVAERNRDPFACRRHGRLRDCAHARTRSSG